MKKVFLEISQNSQENACARASFLTKACNFIKKETLAQMLRNFKNTFFYGTPQVDASDTVRTNPYSNYDESITFLLNPIM